MYSFSIPLSPMASKYTIFSLFLFPLLFLHFHSSTGQAFVNSVYWFHDSGLAASDIDSTLFTHIFCAFADLDSSTKQVTVSSSNNASFSQFTKIVQLKNPSIKTLLSIGGGSANKTAFASLASQSASRKSFIDSSIKLARSYGFYGLDLDWEYPQSTSEMATLGALLNEWRAAVVTEAKSSGKPPLLLTAAFYYAPSINGLNYPVQAISNSLDWVNLMAYDFYDPTWAKVTNAHAALYDPSGPFSGTYGVGSWIQAGMSPKKLVLGLPFYGYAWQLVNANNHGLKAPANGPVGSGNGAMRYRDIVGFIAQNETATTVYNGTIVSNYCYAGTTWIGYDDIQSISAKVSYAKQKGLLGYFAWHVAADNNWDLSKQAKQAWGVFTVDATPAEAPILDVTPNSGAFTVSRVAVAGTAVTGIFLSMALMWTAVTGIFPFHDIVLGGLPLQEVVPLSQYAGSGRRRS